MISWVEEENGIMSGKELFKGELYATISSNFTILFSKHQKVDNRSSDIYVFSRTETRFYTISE